VLNPSAHGVDRGRASKSLAIPDDPRGVGREGASMNLFVLKTWLQAKFSHDERGASMVEYILLVALIALAVIAAVVFLRGQVQSKFRDAGSKLSSNGS
jgi:pilus assembly protein Flp/PilA